MVMKRNLISVILFVLLLAGCATIPIYHLSHTVRKADNSILAEPEFILENHKGSIKIYNTLDGTISFTKIDNDRLVFRTQEYFITFHADTLVMENDSLKQFWIRKRN